MSWGSLWSQAFGQGNMEVNTNQSISGQPVHDPSEMWMIESDPYSASNVMNYDPQKSALDNMLAYAQANNSASAYENYLNSKNAQELSDSAIGRAIKDAEAHGISKYQLFQSGNAGASTPSSSSGLASSGEAAKDRDATRVNTLAKVLATLISGLFGSAAKLM